jgi:hypothetical protein
MGRLRPEPPKPPGHRTMQRRSAAPAASTVTAPFELGSAEWVALPGLGLPAVLARIDTGARTSALHADGIEVYQTPEGPRVRFSVQPVIGRRDVVRQCDAALIARRWVTSSNGERELRCVVETSVQIGSRRWPIEVTLTHRGRMRHRMLLGRRAILDDMVVLPGRTNRQPVLGDGAYSDIPSARPGNADPKGPDARKVGRSKGSLKGPSKVLVRLRIGLIGDGPFGPAWQLLADAAAARGHLVERIDAARCRLVHADGLMQIACDGRLIAPLDAAVALGKLRPGSFVPAVLRQAEMAGASTLNGAADLTGLADPAQSVQMLWAAQIPTLDASLSVGADPAVHPRADIGHRRVLCGLVVEGQMTTHGWFAGTKASREDTADRSTAVSLAAGERRLMIRAARALGLGLARVDLIRLEKGDLAVADIDPAPSLEAFADFDVSDQAAMVIEALEVRVVAKRMARRSG